MSRRLRIAIVSAAVLLAIGVIAVLSLVGVTHTGFGQERVRRMVSSMLAGNVRGKVHVGRISGGFFNGVTIDSLEIRDDEDSLFIATGPIRLRYDSRDLFDRRILLTHVDVQHPIVVLRQHENGEWNFRRVFPPAAQKAARDRRGFGHFIVSDSADIHDGSVILTLPWHPADSLKGARRDSAIRFALASPGQEIRRSREGLARTWRWTGGDATLGYARIADPDSAGRFAQILNAKFKESDPPFLFSNVSGTALNLGDSLWIDSNRWHLPGSRGTAKGKVVWGSNLPVRYYVHVVGDKVSLKDVAWVYPTLPTTGGGRMDLDIRSARDPHLIDYVLTKMDVRTTASHLLGRMTFRVGGPVLIVKDVQMSAAPMDFDLLRQLNGKDFPYDWQGKITGSVRASGGPLNRFRVEESDVIFADAHVPGAITRASGRGELNILFPAFTAFRGFDVDVQQLDLRTFQYLNPLFPKLRGAVSGVATLDSSWLDLRFRNADLSYSDGPAPDSRITGSGRVTWGKYLAYDLNLEAQPLSFTALARSYAGLPLRGEYSGPMVIRGTSPNLLVNTTLSGPAGTIAFNGIVDAEPAGYAARGLASTTALDIRTLLAKQTAPRTALTGEYALDLRGESLASLVGSATAVVARSEVGGVRIEPSLARLRFQNGVAFVDTLALNAAGAEVRALGTVALTGGREGTLRFNAAVDSVGRIRSLLPAGTTVSLFDSIGGRAAIRGQVTGTLDNLAVSGVIEAAGLRSAARTASAARGEFSLTDFLGDRRGTLSITGDTVRVAGIVLDAVRSSVTLDNANSGRFTAELKSRNGVRTDLSGSVARRGESTAIRVDSAVVAVDSANRYRLQVPAHIAIAPGSLTLDSVLLQHTSSAKLIVRNVRLHGDSIRGSLRTDSVDLKLLRAFVPGLTEASGAIVADVEVSGRLKQPSLLGQVSIAGGSATLSNLGTRYRNIRAEIGLSGDSVHIRRLSAETVGERRGSVSVDGAISFERYDNPSFRLNANAQNFHAIDVPGLATLDISTGPTVSLTGSYRAAVMRGRVTVERGTLYIPEVIRKKIIDLSDPDLIGVVDTLLARSRELLPRTPRDLARNLALENVAIDIGPDVWLRSSEANIKLGGSLNVALGPGARPSDPPRLALEGALSADKGTYRLNLVDPFVQPTFDVASGTLRFFGTPDLNPALDIRAIHTVRQPRQSASGRDVRVRVTIGGSLAQPTLALDNPDNLPLSQSDLLSYLVTGEPALGFDNTGDQYRSQIASVALRYGGTLISNAIPKNVLDIVELQTASVGANATERADNPYYYNLLNTRAVLGKQLGTRWFLSLSTGLCFVNPTNFFKENFGIQLEYRINSIYSAQAGLEPGSSDATCRPTATRSFQQTPPQLGFDFFRNWRF